MIKKLFTLGLAIAAFAGNAQQLKTTSIHKNAFSTNLNWVSKTQTVTIDTLIPSSIKDSTCGQTRTYYGWDAVAPQDSGFIFGTGIFPQAGATVTAVGEKYKITGAASVTDVLMIAAVAKGGTVTTTAKIYSENTSTHKPNTTAVGTSATLAMSALTTTGFNTYHFATPVSFTAACNFFAVIGIPAFGGTDGDTLAILSTQQGCSSVDSLSLLKINTGWYYTRTIFGGSQAGDLDLFIFPVININSIGINAVTKGSLSLFAASPNPASNSININFSVEKPSKVEIEIYDVTGKIVKSIKNSDTFATGKNAISVDLSNLEAGSYLYSINANGTKMFSKFIVTK
jgi:hypothetical protein